jgi:hypothetical protein
MLVAAAQAECETPNVLGNVILNGDFSQGGTHWVFSDSSVAYLPGDDPSAVVDYSQGHACVHLTDMYARGWHEQLFAPVRPVTMAFEYSGLLTSDHGIMGRLFRGQTEVLNVYCEGGGIPYFNRILVYILGQLVLEMHQVTPVDGRVQVYLIGSEVILHMNGVEVGQGQIPPGADLNSDRLVIFTAFTNHGDGGNICYDNILLLPDICIGVEPRSWGAVKELYRR